MEVRDSRRVPGLNLIWDRPCAVIDVALEEPEAAPFLTAWSEAARSALEALEWEPEIALRRFQGGASLALAAPLDALYAATEVNEWACAHAGAPLLGRTAPTLFDVLPRLRKSIAREKRRRKGLTKLADAAETRGVSLFSDDDCTSIGMGEGSMSFATAALPQVPSIDWRRVHDVPVALVTGTNGKSTSVRLLAAMVAAAGKTAGLSSTDWVRVGEHVLDRGDYSGPGGARMVLRDQRVEIALLECARGGLARRGLIVRRARAALITNVAEDHLGEWGIHDLAGLAEVKFLVARALPPDGTLVLNADDPPSVLRARTLEGPRKVWFTRESPSTDLRAHLAGGGEAALLEGTRLFYARGSRREVIAEVGELPFLFGGAAGHNVSNALGAIAVGMALELGAGAIARGLAGFDSSTEDNPGRLNRFELGGVHALCDFAHNPHGMRALLSMIAALPARRRLVILGQAGDRDDGSIRELARLTAEARPERVLIKEMPQHLRGRAPGAVADMIADELALRGYPAERVGRAESEQVAVRQALSWAEPGDLLLLLLHAEREGVLEWLARVSKSGWRPGAPLPD